MTLVGSIEEHSNVLPMMLTVQQQQHHHHHHHHHRHHALHIPTTAAAQIHRGNVIVSASGIAGNNDSKTNILPQQQHQQPQQPHHGCKKSKIYNQTSPYGTVPHQPASVARRNARERNRVKQVNNGFAELRERIPQSVAQALGGNTAGTHGGSRAGSKKLSKVETLRMAVEYIRSLQRLLEEHDGMELSGGVSSTSSISSSASTLLGSDSDHCSNAEMRLHSGNTDISSDLGHQQHHYHHQRQNASPTAFMPAPCSEASSSPTPSFVSEASSAGSQGYGTTNSTLYAMHSSNNNEYYDPMTPEDEELLDVITMWQQNQ